MAERDKLKFSEDEDLERARAFWKANGNPIIAGILIGVVAIVGYNYWQHHQRNQGEEASVLFDQAGDPGQSISAADTLMADYSDSPYAALAALKAAGNSMAQGQVEEAQNYLNWVLENAKDDGVKHLARLRLASALIENEEAEKAISLLGFENKANFEARYHELLGDAYSRLDQTGKAAESYQRSLDSITGPSTARGLIQLKLENVNET